MPIKKKAALNPKRQKTTIKDLESRLDVLTNVLTKFVEAQTQQMQQKPVQANDHFVENQPRRRGRRREEWRNEFVDDGIAHAEDKKTDKLLAKLPPVEKGARKTNMATSTCRECGLTEQVPIQVVFESKHTCLACLRKKIGTTR